MYRGIHVQCKSECGMIVLSRTTTVHNIELEPNIDPYRLNDPRPNNKIERMNVQGIYVRVRLHSPSDTVTGISEENSNKDRGRQKGIEQSGRIPVIGWGTHSKTARGRFDTTLRVMSTACLPDLLNATAVRAEATRGCHLYTLPWDAANPIRPRA